MKQELQRIKENLFPGAWASIEDWESFPWHTGRDKSPDTHKPHSSQALALDILGTLEAHPYRDQLVTLMMGWAFPGDGPKSVRWSVDKEVSVHGLGEPRPTQLDGKLEGEADLVALESKFCEAQSGACSQPLRQCNGRYEQQTNPFNGVTARCALSGKGIRYWEHIPGMFNLDAGQDIAGECPFLDGKYQYMRNLVAAQSLAQRATPPKRSFFILLYVAGDLFPVSQEVGTPGSPWNAWRELLNEDTRRRVTALSVQELLDVWTQAFPQDAVLAGLKDWILCKRIPLGEARLA